MSMYRKDRGGFDKLDPDEVEDRWNGRGLARYTPPRRAHETTLVRRAVEAGWPVSDEMKALCLGAVETVLTDPLADHRERLGAVAAVVGMTRVNHQIDQADTTSGGEVHPAVIRVEYTDEYADADGQRPQV